MCSCELGTTSWRTRLCPHPKDDARFRHAGGGLAISSGASAGWNRDAAASVAGGWQDNLRFVLEWLKDPAGTAAIAPSGRALALLITREIDERSGKVLELGPGTGIFTDRLITRGVDQSDLTLVEQNPGFVHLLKQRFPRASVLEIDAAALGLVRPPEDDLFGAAVCGLGLRNMPVRQIEAIMRSAFSLMLPGAALYLFTYGRRCSVPMEVLERLGLVAERLGTALLNLPPASVYRIVRVRGIRCDESGRVHAIR